MRLAGDLPQSEPEARGLLVGRRRREPGEHSGNRHDRHDAAQRPEQNEVADVGQHDEDDEADGQRNPAAARVRQEERHGPPMPMAPR